MGLVYIYLHEHHKKSTIHVGNYTIYTWMVWKNKLPKNSCSWTKSEEVLYEDDEMLVINKPNDLVVHPAPGNWTGTLVPWLLEVYKESQKSKQSEIHVGFLYWCFFSAIFLVWIPFVGKMAEEWISWFHVHPFFCLVFVWAHVSLFFWSLFFPCCSDFNVWTFRDEMNMML